MVPPRSRKHETKPTVSNGEVQTRLGVWTSPYLTVGFVSCTRSYASQEAILLTQEDARHHDNVHDIIHSEQQQGWFCLFSYYGLKWWSNNEAQAMAASRKAIAVIGGTWFVLLSLMVRSRQLVTREFTSYDPWKCSGTAVKLVTHDLWTRMWSMYSQFVFWRHQRKQRLPLMLRRHRWPTVRKYT